ncbi:MAG: HAD family hydrolase [Bdellovibrio sp.]|jgi:FMN phosphatase YigB (HAD superfamily)
MTAKIKAIIWDLDDTLLDTTQLLLPIARTPAFEKRIREPLPLIEGALENLKYLQNRYFFFLLTFGRIEAQQAKVASLGIAPFFKAQYYADPAKNETKTHYFKKIPSEWGLKPHEVLSIGNRRSSDINEAKAQGLQTCLFLYGEHQDEPVLSPFDRPDFEVAGHQELVGRCRL